MKLWTIWVQTADSTIWLEAAWDDDSTSENESGYREAVEKAKATADANGGEMRVVAVTVDLDKIQAAFAAPEIEGTVE